MAHFAQIENNVVTRVLVVDNSKLLVDGQESEQKGIEFLQSLFPGTEWVQTSYSASFRANYAGIGYTWDAVNNAFIAPQPTEPPRDIHGNELQGDWILNAQYRWEFV